MFVRASVVLRSDDDATIVPAAAVVKRDGQTGVFVLSDHGESVHWRVITTGIRHDERIQIVEDALQGEVVTLGQQLLDDGSMVRVQRNKLQ